MVLARNTVDPEVAQGYWRGAGQLLAASIKFLPVLACNRFVYCIKPLAPLVDTPMHVPERHPPHAPFVPFSPHSHSLEYYRSSVVPFSALMSSRYVF